MPHNLDLGGLSINYKCASCLKVTPELGTDFSLLLLFSFLDQTLPGECQMFAELNVLLLTPQFFYLFLHTLHQILGYSILRRARFADAHG